VGVLFKRDQAAAEDPGRFVEDGGQLGVRELEFTVGKHVHVEAVSPISQFSTVEFSLHKFLIAKAGHAVFMLEHVEI